MFNTLFTLIFFQNNDFVWRFTLRRKDRIPNLETLRALIRFRLRGAHVSLAPAPFHTSLDVDLPYKIKGETLRDNKFPDFADDIVIKAVTTNTNNLSEKDMLYLSNLFK